jgi:hypothetical protein
VVEFVTGAPKLSQVFTPEMIESAKKDALALIKELKAPAEITKPVVEWINNEDTIFSPNDVDEIIKNIQSQYESSEEA